jgi:hypothetical protein
MLKNAYFLIFFGLLSTFSDKRKNPIFIPYSVLVFVSRILWTILLPLMIPLIIFKIVKEFINNQDLEDALNNSKKMLAIYSELSEYEWRHPEIIFYRLCKNITTGAKDGDVINVPDLKDIWITLIAQTDVLWIVRQETEEEYVDRYSEYLLSDLEKSEEEQAAYDKKYGTETKETLKSQFKIIIENGKSDTFREFYLGREFSFLKIRVGEPKKITPPELKSADSH